MLGAHWLSHRQPRDPYRVGGLRNAQGMPTRYRAGSDAGVIPEGPQIDRFAEKNTKA